MNDTKYNKIHAANMMVVVWKEKDAIEVDMTPQFPHIVVGEGKTCKDCHGTRVTKEIAEKGQVNLTWWNPETGKLEWIKWIKGVVPIVRGVKYTIQTLVYNTTTGKWVPYKKAPSCPARC